MKRILAIGVLLLTVLSGAPSADFTAQAALAANPAMVARVQVAIVNAAIAIVNESTGTPLHTERAAFARNVVLEPSSYAQRMIWGVVSDGTILLASTDAAISTRVAAIWNVYIAVTTP